MRIFWEYSLWTNWNNQKLYMIGKTTISEVWFKTVLKLLKNEIFANGLQNQENWSFLAHEMQELWNNFFQ